MYEIFQNDFFIPLLLVYVCHNFHLCSADNQRNQPDTEANQLAVDMEANGNATLHDELIKLAHVAK